MPSHHVRPPSPPPTYEELVGKSALVDPDQDSDQNNDGGKMKMKGINNQAGNCSNTLDCEPPPGYEYAAMKEREEERRLAFEASTPSAPHMQDVDQEQQETLERKLAHSHDTDKATTTVRNNFHIVSQEILCHICGEKPSKLLEREMQIWQNFVTSTTVIVTLYLPQVGHS